MVAHGHCCCPVCVEKVERAGLTILRPYVCSKTGVNCLHCVSDKNPTVGWFVDALKTSVINGLAHTNLRNRNC